MNIILVSRKHGRARSLALSNPLLVLSLVLLMVMGAGLFVFGYLVALDREDEIRRQNFIQEWQQDLALKRKQLDQLREDSDQQLKTLAIRMAELYARLIRLDALGEQLIETADLEAGEFNFSRSPAIGGPEEDETGVEYQPPGFIDSMLELAHDIETRELELEVLNNLLGNKDFEIDRYISGRPVKWGWLTSHFGRRNDPFTGRLAWHEGVDFAGKMNSDIVSVAAGVVTWSGKRRGYGNMVEVNHGGNFATRYAHARELKVEVGDVVEKGQTIALMGSSGRSTGPHVHFEVLKNGNPINPARYIKRKGK